MREALRDRGDPFPALEAPAVNAERIRLPEDGEGAWTAVVFYRGHW